MAEFCECGSLVVNGHCSNKSCLHKASGKTAAAGKTAARPKAAAKSPDAAKLSTKASNPRRASKVITYNLYDMQKKEPENE